MISDTDAMRRAVALARKGLGRVEPNPMVGAVIVREGRIAAEGWHERFGGPHAEAAAIASAGAACRGATLYVTLEPCTGLHKKTPPCCDAVLRAGFARVVIGARDPTQDSAAPRLQAAGIEVVSGVLEAECRALIAPFLTLRTQGRSYVIAKWAMSADGRIATAGGASRWISSETARDLVHTWRGQVSAVLAGAGTVRRDDPLLTCRRPGGRNPVRVILDSRAELRGGRRLLESVADAPVWVLCHDSAPEAQRRVLEAKGCRVIPLAGEGGRPDPLRALQALGREALTTVMIEGGAEVLGSFHDRGLIDETRVFVAPMLIGGAAAPGPLGGRGSDGLDAALRLEGVEWTPVGPDMLLTGRRPLPGS